ncbi:hypothetical protein CLV60_112169 [Dyadobacter jiangsuensis]|uniref:Uncharacterized protein n=1 Tax=Dyadobacter jiangsuensis TaxID=1591085 RepID=A0A2P8FU48_9BACT|nr:hypothetical protein CLV60_112169 [Dyadobacter jiangsuensis]
MGVYLLLKDERDEREDGGKGLNQVIESLGH